MDIPLNVQGAFIDTEELIGYNYSEFNAKLLPSVSDEMVEEILKRIKNAERPVLYTGNGIRLSGGYKTFLNVVNKLTSP